MNVHSHLPAEPHSAEPASAALRADPGQARNRVLLGIGFVLASTLFFSLSDVTAKRLTQTLPPLEVTWLRYFVFCVLLFGVGFLRSGARHPLFTRRVRIQVLRGGAMVGSAILFTTSLHLLPIADATAISFVAPIFVLALAAPLLRETVGLRKWLAAVVGLIGVLVVVRPGTGAFRMAALIPIASALLWACTIIATRRMSDTERPETTLAWSALVGFVALSTVVPFHWVRPGIEEIGLGGLIGLLATAGQWLMIRAYAHGKAAVLAPISYAQLIWASALGFVVFGALPSVWTFAGAAIITASGLAMARHESAKAFRDAR